MKAASGPLLALLTSGTNFQTADLWTITLNGGTVIRWSGADIPLVANGNTYALGPLLDRSTISEKVGLETTTLEVTISAGPNDLINGTPIIPFISRRGLDGALVRLDRAFLPDWGDPVTGTALRFSGRVTSIGDIAGSSAKITVSSWMILLNINMPANLYQVACLHAVYDAGCGLDPTAFQSTGTVTGTPTARTFATSLSTVASDYAKGRIIFTSGVNNGLSATVADNDGSGNFTLVRGLPNAPAAGDTFIARPGCDRSPGRCLTRFNNRVHLKSAPLVPVPETIFG